MNDDMNIAAWMIAGGPTYTTSAEARTRSHTRALAAGLARPRITDRLAGMLAALRPAPRLAGVASSAGLDAACCAA